MNTAKEIREAFWAMAEKLPPVASSPRTPLGPTQFVAPTGDETAASKVGRAALKKSRRNGK